MRRILIGVTSDASLVLMRGMPEYLVESGWEVHVACSPGPLLDEAASWDGVTVHPLPMRRDPAPFADLKSLRSWVRLLRLVRPDVSLVGTPKAGLLGGIAGVVTRVPRRVYHLRGLRLETTNGLSRHILIVLERLSARCAHSVLAVSPSLRTRYVELGLAKADKIVVLGNGSSNGVDITRFSPAAVSSDRVCELRRSLGLSADIPVVGFVGRLNVDKGLRDLATARRILLDRGLRHQLLVIGGLDKSDGTEFVDDSGVVETGHVADPRDYYALMDVLCLPTRREGFPNVVLEAAAMGVPSVTTDATGAVDSVLAGATGWITRTGSPESLAEGLAEAIGTPAQLREFGVNARKRTEERFDRADVWSRLSEFLKQ